MRARARQTASAGVPCPRPARDAVSLGMSHSSRRVASVIAALAAMQAFPVSAQSLGTFTWQLQPFCNRITATVTQNGGVYTLDGYDDQCGAPQRAPLVGLATPNPDGTIGLGFHIATAPGGKTVSVESRISLASIGGPWTDSAGNAGSLVLNGAAAGSARPAPVTGPVWGASVVGPSVAAGVGLRLQTAAAGLLTAPPALVVESAIPSGFPTPTSGGIVSNITRGDAIVANAAIGNGISARTAGDLPGSAAVFAVGEGRGFAVHALSANDLPAVYASGGSTSAITAEGGTDNSALGLFNGGIKVSGTVRPAFVHTSAAPNVIGTRTVLDHPLLNGAANAIVVASRAYTAAVGFIAGGFSTFYDTATARWSILREDGSAMPTGVRFNVIVFSQ